MKKVWARVGTTFELSDKDYERLQQAINNNDTDRVNEILDNAKHYKDGNSYLPADAEENPNEYDFDFGD